MTLSCTVSEISEKSKYFYTSDEVLMSALVVIQSQRRCCGKTPMVGHRAVTEFRRYIYLSKIDPWMNRENCYNNILPAQLSMWKRDKN